MTVTYERLLPEETVIGTEEVYADKTYGLRRETGHIRGFVEGKSSVEQAVFKILGTERGAFAIYGDTYGLAIDDLRGLSRPVVESELKRRLEEALTADDRIKRLSDFVFTKDGADLFVSFSLHISDDEKMEAEWRFEALL